MHIPNTVPRVDLLDVNREPSDEELAALMHAAGEKVRIESANYGALLTALLRKALERPAVGQLTNPDQ
jgi:hypothetical protein